MTANPFVAQSNSTSRTIHFSGLTQDEIIAAAVSIMQRGISDALVLKQILDDFEAQGTPRTDDDALVQGCRALILINHFSDYPDDTNKTLVSKFLTIVPSLRDLISQVFELPDYIEIKTISFVDFGVTSIIFKAKAGQRCFVALKLLKPRYWTNERLVQRTISYKEKYNGVTQWSPEIIDVSAHWILMNFVEGVTFQDWLRSKKQLDNKGYYKRVLHIFSSLLALLEEAAAQRHRLSHLDISPKNILIEEREDRDERVWLIDFGRNYAITDRVGPSERYADVVSAVEAYIPPETFSSSEEFSPISDAYSIGLLLTSALVDDELSTETLGNSLIKLWRLSPGLAEYVEQLIEREPKRRLIGFDWDEGEIFSHLRTRLERAVTYFIDTELELIEREPKMKNIWHAMFGIWMGNFSDVKFRTSPIVEGGRYVRPQVNYFRAWAAVSIGCHYLILTSVILLTLVDLQLGGRGIVSTISRNVLAWPFFDIVSD